MMWAACCMVFFGFVQCSEFTSPSVSQYNPKVHLSFIELAVDNRSAPSLFKLPSRSQKLTPSGVVYKYFWEDKHCYLPNGGHYTIPCLLWNYLSLFITRPVPNMPT